MNVVTRPPGDMRPLNCRYRRGTRTVVLLGIAGMLTCSAWTFAAEQFYFPAIAGGLFFLVMIQGWKL